MIPNSGTIAVNDFTAMVPEENKNGSWGGGSGGRGGAVARAVIVAVVAVVAVVAADATATGRR